MLEGSIEELLIKLLKERPKAFDEIKEELRKKGVYASSHEIRRALIKLLRSGRVSKVQDGVKKKFVFKLVS